MKVDICHGNDCFLHKTRHVTARRLDDCAYIVNTEDSSTGNDRYNGALGRIAATSSLAWR